MTEAAPMCRQPDCTVAQTGSCLLGNDPSSCDQRVALEERLEASPAESVFFPPSRACTLATARPLMGSRYVKVVGVLGEPNAGKTACLVSLYLLLAAGKMDHFRYADSITLRAFEVISRGARWNAGHPPEQFTQHTELQDDRWAAFLHLRLAGAQGSSAFDLLMSDLPGEWTSELIEKARADRLEFLKRADVIWLVVDGQKLSCPRTRQGTLRNSVLLAQRLGKFLGEDKPPVIYVVTRRDKVDVADGSLEGLRAIASDAGFEGDVVQIASFVTQGSGLVEPGYGVDDLVLRTTRVNSAGSEGFLEGLEDLGEDSFAPPRIGLTRRQTSDGQ